VSATADPSVIEGRWQDLGARPELAAYAADGFAQVGHALVRAVRDLSGDEWSSALSSGWMAFHVWMAQHLAAGAAAAQACDGQEDGAQGDRATDDRVTTDWTFEDLLSVRNGATPQVAPAPKPR
jgi:hypothetical protein